MHTARVKKIIRDSGKKVKIDSCCVFKELSHFVLNCSLISDIQLNLKLSLQDVLK